MCFKKFKKSIKVRVVRDNEKDWSIDIPVGSHIMWGEKFYKCVLSKPLTCKGCEADASICKVMRCCAGNRRDGNTVVFVKA